MGKHVNAGKPLTPAPAGLHQAVCVDVVELGMVDSAWGPKDTIELRWQVFPYDADGQPMVNPENGKPYMVVNRYNATLSPKSNLHKHLVAWRDRKFTQQELDDFDLDNVLGANCQLQIIHNVSDDGRTFANIQSIVPLGRGMQKFQPIDYTRMKDREGRNQPTQVQHPDDDIPF